MANESVTEQATAGASDVADTAKEHPVIIGLAVLLIVAAVIRWRNPLAAKLGSFLPAWAKRGLAITGFILPFAVAFLAADAQAACCMDSVRHVVHAASASASDGLGHVLAYLAAGGSGALVLGSAIAGMGQPDLIEAKLEGGSKAALFDPTASASPKSFDFYVDGSINVVQQGAANAGDPLMALDQVISLEETFETVPGGSELHDDDLAAAIQSVTMTDAGILGTLMDETTGTGPVLKHIVEFIGLSYNRGCDAPVATITVPSIGTTDKVYTRYLTIPHAQRWLPSPMSSALWLGIADQLRVTVKCAPSIALDGISTGALIKGPATLRVNTPYLPYKAWHQPVIPYYRLEQPLAGSKSFSLQQFGEAGPSGTNPIDWVFLIAQLSNQIGLPGNTRIGNILQIDCPKLGITMMEDVASFVKARLMGQVVGRTASTIDPGNYAYADTVIADGMNLDSLKALYLRAPALGQTFDNMLKVRKGYKLDITETFATIPTTPAHAILVGAMRFLSDAACQRTAKLPGSQLKADRQTVVPSDSVRKNVRKA